MRGIINAGGPKLVNWLWLLFVFVPCARASGRGEAVQECERELFVNAGPHNGEMCSGRDCVLGVFAAMRMLFSFSYNSLLYFRCFVFCVFLMRGA